MKNTLSKASADRPSKPKKAADKNPSDVARQLGGQPENDEDARAAGFPSATADTPRKPSGKGE